MNGVPFVFRILCFLFFFLCTAALSFSNIKVGGLTSKPGSRLVKSARASITVNMAKRRSSGRLSLDKSPMEQVTNNVENFQIGQRCEVKYGTNTSAVWSPGEICGIDESAVRVSFPLSPDEYDIPMDLARNPKRFRVTPGAEVGNQTGPASVPTQTHATPMHNARRTSADQLP